MSTQDSDTDNSQTDEDTGLSFKTMLIALGTLLGVGFITMVLPGCFTIFCVVVGIIVAILVDPNVGLYTGGGLFICGCVAVFIFNLFLDYEPSNKKFDNE